MSSIPPSFPSGSGGFPSNNKKRRISESSELSEKLGDLSIKRKKVKIFSNKKEDYFENMKKLPLEAQTKIFEHYVDKLPTGEANILTAHLINGKIFQPLSTLKKVLGKTTAKAHDGLRGGLLHVFLKPPDKEDILKNVKSKNNVAIASESKLTPEQRAANSLERRKALYDYLAEMLRTDMALFRKIRAINEKLKKLNPSTSSRSEIDKLKKELRATSRPEHNSLVYMLTKKGFVTELESIKSLIKTFYRNTRARLHQEIPALNRSLENPGIIKWEKNRLENQRQEGYKLLEDIQKTPETSEDIECLNYKIEEAKRTRQLVQQIGEKYPTHQDKLNAFLRKMENPQDPMTCGLIAAWEQAGLKAHHPDIAYMAVKHLRKDVLKGLADLGVDLAAIRIRDTGQLAERERQGTTADQLAHNKAAGGTLIQALLSRGQGESVIARKKRIEILKMFLEDKNLRISTNSKGDYPALTAFKLDSDSEIKKLIEEDMMKDTKCFEEHAGIWKIGNSIALSPELKKRLPQAAKNRLLFYLPKDVTRLPTYEDGEEIILDRAKEALDLGADVNYKNPNEDNATPLHNAVRYLNRSMVDLLLRKGARTSSVTEKTRETPLHQVGSMLLMEDYAGDVAAIYDALLTNKADPANPNAKDHEGNTAAHALISNYQYKDSSDENLLFKLLILLKTHKADLHIPNKKGVTPYDLLKERKLLSDTELKQLTLTGGEIFDLTDWFKDGFEPFAQEDVTQGSFNFFSK